MKRTVIGIDLGTTNSCVAVHDGDQTMVIENSEGKRTTPSVVSYDEEGVPTTVGEQARRSATINTSRVVYEIKRFMGKKYGENLEGLIKGYVPSRDMAAQFKEAFPYEVVRTKDDRMGVRVGSKTLLPEEISAHILARLKKDAEDRLGISITEAVITVPAYFNDTERLATKNAAEIAGLKVLRLINEPTAAALAYGAGRKGADQKILVFDLGGGTFDVSILDIDGEGTIEVKATTGDTLLGGSDFDQLIIDFIKKRFQEQHNMPLISANQDLKQRSIILQRLREEAEEVKKSLSSVSSKDIHLPFLTTDQNKNPINFSATLTRTQFESMSAHLVKRCFACVDTALQKAKLSKSDINEVLLVGGMTRMPLIAEEIRKIFGKEPNKTVNPDEVVAVGAAIQGYILGGGKKDLLLLDVTPLSLGLETLGGLMTVLIPSNTTIPTKQDKVFSTASDDQPGVTIRVFQGERPMAEDNKLLGQFELSGIPPARRGVPQIQVVFDMDASGLLTVTAQDKGTGKSQKVSITQGGGLNKEEIETMRREAAENSAADEIKKQSVHVRNEARSFVDYVRQSLREHSAVLSDELKKEVEEAADAAERALEGSDSSVETIKTTQDHLREISMKIGPAVYNKTDGQTASPDHEPNPSA